jgi:prepilin-type N-terminal cleavage/methylation domain-containing protein
MLQKKSGFTALELATTIAIVAVIAALVMPPYLRWNRAHRLEGAATNLTADLEMAKVRAIRENAFVVVEFNTDSYTIFVDNGEGGGTAADWNRNGSEIIAQDRDLPTGVQIDTASLSFPSFNSKTRFNGRGIPPDILGPEIVSIANTINSRLITINRLGFINVQ